MIAADVPYHIMIEKDREYFSSKKTKIFLPIGLVRQDTSRSSNTGPHDKYGHSDSANVQIPTKSDEVNNPYNLVVGSSVQYLPSNYGVIKWIGTLPGVKLPYAGLEMVRHHEFVSSLLYLSTIFKKTIYHRKMILLIAKMEYGQV